MKITFIIKPDTIAASRVRAYAPLDEVMKQLARELPHLLTPDTGNKSSRKSDDAVESFDIEVTQRYAREGDDEVKLAIKVDPEGQPIEFAMNMPYDKVWHAIIDWFTRGGWMFPAESFRYDIGEHGMINHGRKQYRCW